MTPSRRVAVLATLDTKADEADFVIGRLAAHGCQPWLVDLGTGGVPTMRGDTAREDLLARAGTSTAALSGRPKSQAMEVVADAATEVLLELMEERSGLGGVIAVGGGQGTWLASTVMRGLPLGLPKVMVTSIAHRAALHVQSSDIIVFPSVTDVAGLNRILRRTLDNAAAAVAGMVPGALDESAPDGPAVAMTMFGVTTAGGEVARRVLEAAGYEVAVFHANGPGGAAMESLVRSGTFDGVLDWTTTELADELVGGIASAGPARLEAAGAAGLPQVVAPGALDVINFGPPDTVPARHSDRLFHQHTPAATLMRTSEEEMRQLAEVVAEKLNQARGPVRVLIPSAGFSALDAPGEPFCDEGARRRFTEVLAAALRDDIACVVHQAHINDAEFAEAAARALVELLSEASNRQVLADSHDPQR